ncbi:uncharacterized protein BP01DRAFT_348935 [Aspergillus saccharolyticus JOP 1030-1]|uniref:N-acetyltransferase domain-containing protein n=1 Tax=Aspergillus saccharolyticus JOP 1030-1 TaxID=1450539 RepID=A0A318Z4Y0_9EURO|nr:hypothetical protein BP01DRAFT_348935 [Aspergillus saccharolyticus JOP 1030-1]PYH41504.1 hypothetical protein BP01DRAFT_348935 [Aspergillus saccharolyticus JOP 1030-1]
MRFRLSELDPATDALSEFVACQIASFDEPFQSIYRFFYPIFGGESEAERQEAFTNLPGSVFLQVRDQERDDKFVAGVYFKIHKQNPYAPKGKGSGSGSSPEDESPPAAVWYPEGMRREYITRCIEIFSEPHMKFMQKPHLYAFVGFALPEYRQLGLADMVLAEICRRADELGLEAWLEAVTPIGVTIYKRHGFIPFSGGVSVQPPATEVEAQNADWQDIEAKMQPLRYWPMWRPPQGKTVLGEATPPWGNPRKMRGLGSRL